MEGSHHVNWNSIIYWKGAIHRTEIERPFLASKYLNTNLVKFLLPFHVVISNVHFCSFTCTISDVHRRSLKRFCVQKILSTKNYNLWRLGLRLVEKCLEKCLEWNFSKKGAGHNPGWFIQFLHWYLDSFLTFFFVQTTNFYCGFDFFSVTGINFKNGNQLEWYIVNLWCIGCPGCLDCLLHNV